MNRPFVTVIVLAWNRWDLTRRCLDSLQETDLSNAEVLVVDNGSTDQTPERLAEYPWLRVIRNKDNLGFVRGNNIGIAAAAGSDVVLVNNDIEFTQSDWLIRLRECAVSAPDIGIVGCRLKLSDGRLLHAGTYILPDTMWGQQIGALEKDVNQYAGNRPVQGIVFACALIKRELIDRIGLLSEDYESYFEDTDYCLRAQAAGFSTYVCGSVTLIHDEHGSTEKDPAGFERVFNASRDIFRKKWADSLEQSYTSSLLWQSIMNFPSGYAMSCREMLKALDRQQVRVAYDYVYGPGTVFPVSEPEQSNDYLLNVLRQRSTEPYPLVSIVYGQGDVFYRNRGQLKIGFTMLEVDGFPAEWVRQANVMDEVWVPTEFNRLSMLECGVRVPVYVIPLGIDANYFHPGVVSHPNPKSEFVFLSNFEWGERKQPELLLKAFNEVFTSDEPVRLVCKIINRDPGVQLSQEIRRLSLSSRGGRISLVINREFPYYQLGSLYRSADCYVSAGRGEGWDMPLMEALACGTPAIATDWGAHREFFHEGVGYPLRVRGTVPAQAKCPYYDGFSWADPDPEHLRYLLRYVYENREEAAARGRAAAQGMGSTWSWDRTAGKILDRIAAIETNSNPATRV